MTGLTFHFAWMNGWERLQVCLRRWRIRRRSWGRRRGRGFLGGWRRGVRWRGRGCLGGWQRGGRRRGRGCLGGWRRGGRRRGRWCLGGWRRWGLRSLEGLSIFLSLLEGTHLFILISVYLDCMCINKQYLLIYTFIFVLFYFIWNKKSELWSDFYCIFVIKECVWD